MRCALLLAVLLALSTAGANGLLVSFPHISANPQLEAELLAETNAARARNGLGPLMMDESLALAARHHAQEMASLGYLAHESPSDGIRNLSQRLNRSGAMMEAAAENLAFLQHVPDLAVATVQGWLDSPGHRTNLLGQYNLVGFGSAQTDSGGHYVVQVLGLQTVGISRAAVREMSVPVLNLDLTIELDQPAEVGLWLGSEFQGAQLLAAGRQLLSVPIDPAAPVHVNTGTRRPGTPDSEAFIAAASGWFDPISNSWSASATGAADAQVAAVGASWTDERRWDVQLNLTTLPATRIGLWLDGQWQSGFAADGSLLHFHVPAATAAGTTVSIGFEQPDGSGNYVVFGHFRLVHSTDGAPALQTLNPGK